MKSVTHLNSIEPYTGIHALIYIVVASFPSNGMPVLERLCRRLVELICEPRHDLVGGGREAIRRHTCACVFVVFACVCVLVGLSHSHIPAHTHTHIHSTPYFLPTLQTDW